jgi:effector-binding domain-containing protein
MSDACEIIDRPAQPVLSVRTRVPVQDLPQVLGKVYGEIWQYLGELHEAPAGAAYVAYYNMDMQDLDLEIGFPVLRPLPGKAAIQPGTLPAGNAAAYLFTGPYNQISHAYEKLNGWIQQNGYTVTGVAYEFYLNDPACTPPEELQTQIFFPLTE